MLWQLICYKYIEKGNRLLHIPFNIYGNFDNRYVIYDDNDNVKYGAKNMFEAMQYCKKEKMYMTKIIDK